MKLHEYAFQGGAAESVDPPTRPLSEEMRAIYLDLMKEEHRLLDEIIEEWREERG